MINHFRLSPVDCLEIVGVDYRLIRSDRTGSIWARLDDDNTIRIAARNTAPMTTRSFCAKTGSRYQ